MESKRKMEKQPVQEKQEYIDWGNYEPDCIHLHACRLMQKKCENILKKRFARHCGEDCNAFERVEDLLTNDAYKEEVKDGIEKCCEEKRFRIDNNIYIYKDVEYAIGRAVDDIEFGYSSDDIFVENYLWGD